MGLLHEAIFNASGELRVGMAQGKRLHRNLLLETHEDPELRQLARRGNEDRSGVKRSLVARLAVEPYSARAAKGINRDRSVDINHLVR